MVQMQSLLFAENDKVVSYFDAFIAIRSKDGRDIDSAIFTVIHFKDRNKWFICTVCDSIYRTE